MISYGIVSSRSGVAILRTAIHLLLTYSTHFHWLAFRSSRPAIWHEILLVACPFMTLNQHFQSTAGNSEHCCHLLLLPLLHPFNGLFSMTTWVSRHHVETETSRNWISSEQTVVGNDLPGNNYLVQRDKSMRTDEAI